MLPDRPSTVEIFCGAAIQYVSERRFLDLVVQKLVQQKISAVIFANFMLGARQIDFVVATRHAVFLTEVKSSYFPVRGGLNGDWARQTANGEWAAYRNAYQQAVDGTNRLRDVMQAFKPFGRFYPSGHVVFTDPLPDGSALTPGDFKATITEMAPFLERLTTEKEVPWALEDWSAFARKLDLTPITLREALAPPESAELLRVVSSYNAAVSKEYGRQSAIWLPETPVQGDQLLAAAWRQAGCFLSGPSGCGKSLMAKWLAAKLAMQGYPTVYLAAKDFAGSWAKTLRKEIGLVTDESMKQLLRAVPFWGRPVFLIVDGINEFGTAATERLRGVQALARRLCARLVLTSQQPETDFFGGLYRLDVGRPSVELKRQIAVASGGPVTSVADGVLRMVDSGMEAAMVGQIGHELNLAATRPLLIDQYIRKRLGSHARAGSHGLRQLAGRFHQDLAFSISEEAFDGFMLTQHIAFTDCDALFTANLLTRRAGRVSFVHEMIQNACTAFELARRASLDPQTFGCRLSTPILKPLAQDVIAVVEDAAACRALLAQATDPELLAVAASGHCGPLAMANATALLNQAALACADEISRVTLDLFVDGEKVQIQWKNTRSWSAAEEARLRAIGLQAASGTNHERYLDLCADMDERLQVERPKWSEFCRQHRYPLRSQSFALTYYGFGPSIGFTEVTRAIQPSFRTPEKNFLFNLEPRKLSSGQLHFFLEHARRIFDKADDGLAELLLYLIRERFRWEPYHVQLSILHSVYFMGSPEEALRQQLVDALQELDVGATNWGINSSILDALKRLDAIDDDDGARRELIRSELASVLVDDERLVDGNFALSLLVAMFDHPYDWIYGEEICSLDEFMQQRLYRRALTASRIKESMNLSWLVNKVASFDQPADGSLLSPFVALPSRTNPFVQEEWGAFTTAVRFMGRHQLMLARVEVADLAEDCIAQIRCLLHASEAKTDITQAEAVAAWRRLHEMPPQLVVGCLSEFHLALAGQPYLSDDCGYPPLNLADLYSKDCLSVARRFIDAGEDAVFFHRAPWRDKALELVFGIIGLHGDRSDIDRLRNRSRAHAFATHALAALRQLDGSNS